MRVTPRRARISKRLGAGVAACLVGYAAPLGWAASGRVAAPPASEAQELERLERAAFRYLWKVRDARSGLVYNTSEPHAPASPTAVGVALAAIPVGVERGWINRADGEQRALRLLRAMARAEAVHGFYYHFLDSRSGTRTWSSEVSCIDSAIFIAGAMVAAEYFKGTAVERTATGLINQVEWPWFLDGEETLQWAWRPEGGFEGGPMNFSEAILAYLLAMGSPTHPIPPSAWEAIRRPITRAYASDQRMVYTADGSLFAYLLPLAWFDLQDRHDAYLDYWTNAKQAILSNIRFSQAQAGAFRTYREGLWGLSAALGPDGYKAYGAPPAERVLHDGTVAPYVVAASIPWVPDLAIAALRRMEQLSPSLWTRYGLGNAFNLDRGYASPHSIALDQGLALLMIENARTGLIWNLFMRHPVAQRGLSAARFQPGRLDEPVTPAMIPGNPGDALSIPMIDHAVAIDGDLREWIRREALELTPTNRRNVESGVFRGAGDASVVAYLGWTNETFYVAGIITDDERVNRRRGSDIYKDDCLELFWDLDGDGFRFDGNPQDVQIGLAPSGPEGTRQLWAWGALKRIPQEVQAAVKRERKHALFELAIPRALLPGLTPGRPIRFGLAYHDRDLDGKTAKLHWSIDTASAPGTILFGHLTLEPTQEAR